MPDPNAILDPEGVARGDYYDPNAEPKTVVPPAETDSSKPADSAGNAASATGEIDETDPAKTGETDDNPDAGAAAEGSKAVPYGRFKDVVDQKNEAQKRIADLEARLAAVPAAPAAPDTKPVVKDVVKELTESRAPLYKQVEEARLDGEVDLAAELQQKIDDINAAILLEKSSAVSKSTLAVDREAQRYDLLVDSLEAAHPQFRHDAPEYDPVLVKNINETADAFEATGMTSTKALQKAVAMLMPAAASAAPAAPVVPVVPVVPAAKPDVAKSIAAVKGQPADMSGAGVNKDDVKLNPSTMSDEEYDKLPESTKAKLRGDFTA